MKRIIIICCILCVVFSSVYAQSGRAGELSWNILDGTLTISGKGIMPNYGVMNFKLAPWLSYRDSIYRVVIGNSVTNISDYAFAGCNNMTSIIIPNSVTTIGVDAFRGSGLNSVTIPNSVKVIEKSAFEDCNNLVSIVLPESITEISDRLFFGCASLSSVNIPNSVTTIGNEVFYLCRELTAVTIPNSVTSIGNYVFAYSGLNSVIIPNTVVTIGYAVFLGSNLTSVTIPGSVIEIGHGICHNCTVDVADENTVYSSVDGVLFSKDKTTLFFFPCGMANSYIIPSSVNSLGFRAFDCKDLTSIEIPASVTNFDSMAFGYCNFTEIINLAPTPQTISNYLFISVDKKKCILRVQNASIDAYRNAEGWKEFENIAD